MALLNKPPTQKKAGKLWPDLSSCQKRFDRTPVTEANIAQAEKKKETISKTFLDIDFFSDPKIQAIEYEHGTVAIAWYLKLALLILKEGGRLNRKLAQILLRPAGCDDPEGFLAHCLILDLFYNDGDALGSKRADRELEILTDKRNKWRDKQRQRRVSHECLTRVSKDSEEEEEGEQEKEVLNILEKGVQGEKPFKPPKPKFHLPEALERWVAYRKKIGKPIKEPTIEGLLKEYQGREADLARDVTHSINKGYQGLFAPSGNGPSPPRKLDGLEQARALHEQILAGGLKKLPI